MIDKKSDCTVPQSNHSTHNLTRKTLIKHHQTAKEMAPHTHNNAY